MKKFFVWILVLGLVFTVGCGDKNVDESTASGESEVITLGEEDIEILVPTAGVTEGRTEESTVPTEKRTLLKIEEYGTVSGPYLEDGSDETVQNVICALIRNTGDGYLDYGLVSATAGDEEFTFVVTGLPGGDAVWVMEKDRKPLPEGATLEMTQEQVSGERDVTPTDERITMDLLDGKISITNVSDRLLTSVRVYYKQIHEDGNFLGGITYTSMAENIEAGATVEIPGGHSRATGCAIVRVDITE